MGSVLLVGGELRLSGCRRSERDRDDERQEHGDCRAHAWNLLRMTAVAGRVVQRRGGVGDPLASSPSSRRKVCHPARASMPRTGPILAFLGITGTVLVGVVPNFYLAFTSPISAWIARRVLLPASNFASTFFSNSPILLVIPSCASLFSVCASSTFLLILPSLRLTIKLTIHAMNPKKPTVTPTTVAISVKVIPCAVCAGTGTGTITSCSVWPCSDWTVAGTV